MSTPWLERLAAATTYGELQAVFGQIRADAHNAADPGAVAAGIREAVVRVERERERDEDALRAFEKDYAAFRADQRGVTGWLKRHLPFTETRRREKEHKGALSDQHAEILGDSLVIARAQMLCEHLVPAEERATGLLASEWRAVLTADASLARIGAYAETVTALGRQLARARTFVAGVGADIEAFDDAHFVAEDDERRRRADVEAARTEVAVFAERVEAVEAVRREAFDHMRGAVSADLEDADPAFGRLGRQVRGMESAVQRAGAALEVLEELREGVAGLRKIEERLVTEPEQRRQLEAEVQRLGRETEDAARHTAEAEAELVRPAERYERALRDEQRARAEVRSAQDALSTHLETTGQFELEPGESLENATPADAALTRAQAALQSTHAELRSAEAPYESAKAFATHARERTNALEQRLAQAHAALKAVDGRFARLREAFDRGLREFHPVLERLPDVARSYRAGLRDVDRSSALPADHEGLRPPQRFEVPGFAFDGDSDLERAAEHWTQLAATLEAEQAMLGRDLTEIRTERDSLWQGHAVKLLGAEVAAGLVASA